MHIANNLIQCSVAVYLTNMQFILDFWKEKALVIENTCFNLGQLSAQRANCFMFLLMKITSGPTRVNNELIIE